MPEKQLNSSVMIKRDFLEKNNIRYNPEWRYLEDVIFFYDIVISTSKWFSKRNKKLYKK